jgi:hypothetical protein
MQTIIQTVVVILFFALAVWYLYRRFKGIVAPNPSSRGCGGCNGCSMHPETTKPKELFDETNQPLD